MYLIVRKIYFFEFLTSQIWNSQRSFIFMKWVETHQNIFAQVFLDPKNWKSVIFLFQFGVFELNEKIEIKEIAMTTKC